MRKVKIVINNFISMNRILYGNIDTFRQKIVNHLFNIYYSGIDSQYQSEFEEFSYSTKHDKA